MSVVDRLRDLVGRRASEPLVTDAQRAVDRLHAEQMREARELAEARRVIGAWGDPIADGLSRQLGVPVVFEPDPASSRRCGT